MSDRPNVPAPRSGKGLNAEAARSLEYGIIGVGVVALALIFQPFSLSLFGLGCALVVFAGLANNLLPLCRPGTTIHALVQAVLVVALVFCVVTLLSIAAAYLYGAWFVTATTPETSEPFYRQSFVLGVALVAVLLAAAILALKRRHG
jgi:hypothetical protein